MGFSVCLFLVFMFKLCSGNIQPFPSKTHRIHQHVYELKSCSSQCQQSLKWTLNVQRTVPKLKESKSPDGLLRSMMCTISLLSLHFGYTRLNWCLPCPDLCREGNGNPLNYSCLGNLHGQKSLVGYSPSGCKESDMTEWLALMQLLWNDGDRSQKAIRIGDWLQQ